MENKETEVLETQEAPEVETPEVEEENVTLSKAELEDLKHRAEVSSQNFERAKKAENRVKELETLEIPLSEELDDPKYNQLQEEISSMKRKLEEKDVFDTYPKLKELKEEFTNYLEDSENRGMPIKVAAKAFLAEKGLLESKRIGLEKPTGGRQPAKVGLSVEDIERIRKNDHKKYRELIKKGQIKI